MSECTSCKFREGDCGHHHVDYDGNLHLDIPGLPSCDKYGQCMSWERSIESRRKEIGEKLTAIMKALQKIKDLEDEIAAEEQKEKEAVDMAIEALKERPHGEWIFKNGKYRCSFCLEPCATFCMNEPRDNFCLWCGAELKKEGDVK